ncbi:Pyruvate phosphate dikinase, PEP/pyruvate binding domain [Corynebacterium pollutisoli]|uniref:Phosphoenolpyruvate synthase n=1 Tax=Corynebacterium pollutisoli TaxID=1610489 RepID=A0A1X7K0W5_9CORY|nr:PEP/pyruvate-binding domain-containing protein [Corynebacterium pollutisoli]SMG34406.1 Pyruvate phosphate dikinase, PEP/pyruvate binding domain [Corynebacterium pollutisoli]
MYTLTYNQEECTDPRRVGGKTASLAEMLRDGMPVAPGYGITVDAYRDFLDQGDTRERLAEILDDLTPTSGQAAYDEAEEKIAEVFDKIGIPEPAATAIRDRYQELCDRVGIQDVSVAVRSSATAEDSVDASFAGEFETWVDIVGADDVIEHVLECYRSVYTGRVLTYLASKGIRPQEIEMAVVVQKTVRARSAGVLFTVTPITGDRTKISLDASWGLGLAVVGGEVTPDHWVVDKITHSVVSHTPGDKRIEYRRGDAPVPVDESRWIDPCMSDEEVLALAELALEIEKRRDGAPQDIEFAIDEELPAGENIILLQCRPETVWSNIERKPAFDSSASMMNWITGTISGNAV